MNGKSETVKTRMTVEEASKITKNQFEELQRQLSSGETFEDKALEKFIKKPNESINLSEVSYKKWDTYLLLFLFAILVSASIIGGVTGNMEIFVVVPIAVLSLLGILILIKDLKK